MLTVRVFFSLDRQWREIVTMGGKVLRRGLDREQIKSTLELMRVKKRKWPEIFDGLKAMEAEALEALYE